ncbi:hypothetical protein D920_01172 [Enterococcus faecalis 13-SD-W-01]|nr:hypothetical protein D920_01172 [Enterococcus faecalis 13-SD-W-01]
MRLFLVNDARSRFKRTESNEKRDFMKLVETPINTNLTIKTFYPKVVDFFLGDANIKYYKFYALDRTQILYADTYDKEELIMINSKKKITKQEIDYAIRRILKSTREEAEVHVGVKQQMERLGIQFTRPNKDIVIIAKEKESES